MNYKSVAYLSALKKTGRVTIGEFPVFVQDFAYRAIEHLAEHGLVEPVKNIANDLVVADLTKAGLRALQRLKS